MGNDTIKDLGIALDPASIDIAFENVDKVRTDTPEGTLDPQRAELHRIMMSAFCLREADGIQFTEEEVGEMTSSDVDILADNIDGITWLAKTSPQLSLHAKAVLKAKLGLD